MLADTSSFLFPILPLSYWGLHLSSLASSISIIEFCLLPLSLSLMVRCTFFLHCPNPSILHPAAKVTRWSGHFLAQNSHLSAVSSYDTIHCSHPGWSASFLCCWGYCAYLSVQSHPPLWISLLHQQFHSIIILFHISGLIEV